MMFLSGVDPQQVVDVNSGKCTGRGCGKTIAKMVQLLSYLRYSNGDKRYLFICENEEMAVNISYYFYFWIDDLGLCVRNVLDEEDALKSQKSYYTVVVKPPVAFNILDAFKMLFRKTEPDKDIYVKFVYAGWEIECGIKQFDRIIIDVSPEKRDLYNKEISQVLSYGQKNW